MACTREETISSKNSNFPSNKHSRTFPISLGNFLESDALAGTKFKYLPVYVFISVFVAVHLLWLRARRRTNFIKSAQFYQIETVVWLIGILFMCLLLNIDFKSTIRIHNKPSQFYFKLMFKIQILETIDLKNEFQIYNNKVSKLPGKRKHKKNRHDQTIYTTLFKSTRTIFCRN